MSKEFKSRKFAGVYYREIGGNDRSYFLRVRMDGKVKRIPIGKKSEGITEQFCNQEKHRILNAHRFGEETAAQLQKVTHSDPSFEELFDWYIERRELKASTVKHLQIIRKVPFYKSRKVSREDVQTWVDAMAVMLRPATVTLRYRQVRAVMRYAIQREKYKFSDPTVGIDLPKSTGPRKRYLTPKEIQRLLEALKGRRRLYLFVKMSLCTGARMGTLLSVHSDQIKSDGTVNLYNHKSERWYQGFFDEETMNLLKYKKGYVLALKGKEDKVPAAQSIQYRLQEVLNELFNDEGTPPEKRAVVHTLRHSVATQQVRKGVPIEVISKTLDHSSINVTSQIYAKIAPELIKKSVENLWD